MALIVPNLNIIENLWIDLQRAVHVKRFEAFATISSLLVASKSFNKLSYLSKRSLHAELEHETFA